MARHTQIHIRERVIKFSKDGKSSREIASLLSIGKSTVNDIITKYRAGYGLEDRPRSGRPRKTSKKVDRVIKRKSTADVKKTAAEIARELQDENLADVSRSTVTRRLHDVELFGRIGIKKPLISKKNKKARLQFAKDHKNWTVEDWKKVAFSDESKFNLFGGDGRQYVRRPVGTRNNVRYQIPTVKHYGGSVMIWGIFSAQGVGPLVEINGTMNAAIYRDILDKNLLTYAEEKMPQDWIFQQDNDPKHTSKLLKEWFSAKNVRVLSWPSRSPDLNPIEHLWEQLNRQIRKHTHSNKATLFKSLKEEWNKIAPASINRLIESMPDRCAAVIAAKGIATKY